MVGDERSDSGATWVHAIFDDELPIGTARRVSIEGINLVIGRVDDYVFAVLDQCPHLELPFSAFGPLTLARGRLTCPWHFWEFDVRTGRCEYAALYRDDEMFFFQIEGRTRPIGDAAGQLRSFPVRSRGNTIQVLLPADPCDSTKSEPLQSHLPKEDA